MPCHSLHHSRRPSAWSTCTGASARVNAIDGVTLDVPVGQIVALLGPNGAGKSTVNELVLGLTTPDRGRVEVFGENPLAALRTGRVGAMLQGGALLAEATAKDMLALMHGLQPAPPAAG